MDEFEKNDVLVDQGEIDSFLIMVESCDSEEAKQALEASLLGAE